MFFNFHFHFHWCGNENETVYVKMIFLNKKWWCDDEILWDSPRMPQAAGTCGVSISEGCGWMNLLFWSRFVFTCWMIILGSWGSGMRIWGLYCNRAQWGYEKSGNGFFKLYYPKISGEKHLISLTGNLNNYIPVMFGLIRNIVIAFPGGMRVNIVKALSFSISAAVHQHS